jgi:4-diphosphocytidyl-2-C-methyl-D-erythritol kinase
LGRRADGFHELRSLVAFAGLGDTVELAPGEDLTLVVEGPFANALHADNLILRAVHAANAQVSDLRLGRFRLVKTLPVAAGLGGGSADAAAALRVLALENEAVDPVALAPDLGSDVAVCLASKPALITGRGENVNPVRGFPQCGVLLANPGVALSTAEVYGALRASACEGTPLFETPNFEADFGSLIAYADQRANDLETVAKRLAPEIEAVVAALGALPGVRLARLSGSGATCFAVFATAREAHRAATLLAEEQPTWWIASSSLGDPTRA